MKKIPFRLFDDISEVFEAQKDGYHDQRSFTGRSTTSAGFFRSESDNRLFLALWLACTNNYPEFENGLTLYAALPIDQVVHPFISFGAMP